LIKAQRVAIRKAEPDDRAIAQERQILQDCPVTKPGFDADKLPKPRQIIS
jgi:hypothetical protein